jgi:hypothetical protein
MRRFVLISFMVISIANCIPQQIKTPIPTSLPSTAGEAYQTLTEFFALLNEKKYTEADSLYGGSYEQMQDWNPDIDPSDRAALWARACEQNGLRCLLVRTATFKRLEGEAYVFQVEFSNPDRSLFVLGPCCGANETDMPPVSQFEYKMTRTAEGKFVVMNLPPYVP